jgi:hypothetical protein
LGDLALGADQPLGHRWLGHQEGPGDLGRGHADHGPQRQRQTCLDAQRGVAAAEQHGEPLVAWALGSGRAHCGVLGQLVGLAKAASLRRPGRYQLQAALAGCHASAATWAQTDWLQIVTLYDMLIRLDASPVIRLNQAIAMSWVWGPRVALAAVEEMADRLGGYQLFHATRAQLLERLGDHAAARSANERALALTDNPAEQALLHARLDQ